MRDEKPFMLRFPSAVFCLIYVACDLISWENWEYWEYYFL